MIEKEELFFEEYHEYLIEKYGIDFREGDILVPYPWGLPDEELEGLTEKEVAQFAREKAEEDHIELEQLLEAEEIYRRDI